MAQNLHDTQSVKHFQDLLSEDLKRVSLIYFWTPWAEPCKQMNEVVEELSKKYPVLLFIKASHSSRSSNPILSTVTRWKPRRTLR
jgi:thiol-disulfide isomerase/thioredoxin